MEILVIGVLVSQGCSMIGNYRWWNHLYRKFVSIWIDMMCAEDKMTVNFNEWRFYVEVFLL